MIYRTRHGWPVIAPWVEPVRVGLVHTCGAIFTNLVDSAEDSLSLFLAAPVRRLLQGIALRQLGGILHREIAVWQF